MEATKAARIERIATEARLSLAEGDNNAAIVLLVLAGAMHMNADDRLAGLCQIFAEKAKADAEAIIAELRGEAA